jgi:hypothetical protein
MQEIEFTIWQRLSLLQVLGGLRGDLSVMRRGVKVMDKVDLSQDERESAGVRPEGNSLKWENQATKTIELTEPEFSLVKRVVRDYQGWTLAGADELFDLAEKLDIEISDKDG